MPKKPERPSSLPRLGGDEPDINSLKGDWSTAVNHRQSNFWSRQRLNWEARFCVWANQTSDGRRWPAKNSRSRVWPWPGAADSRVHLVDKYVCEDVALLMSVWANQKLIVNPVNAARDASWARRMTALGRWQLYEDMEEAEDEAEFLANLMLERGCAAMGVWWDYQETATRATITRDQILQAAMKARLRIRNGEQGDALDFEANLPLYIADPSLESEAVKNLGAALAASSPNLTPSQLRDILRSLRQEGVAHFPVKSVAVNKPCVRALVWNEDLWTPPEVGNLQKSRQVFLRELLTDADVAGRAQQYGWDGDYTDEVLEKHRGKTSMIPLQADQKHRFNLVSNRWNATMVPDDSERYEIVTAYERLLDKDGIPGIYVTPFCPSMSDGFASSELLDYSHGQYPFVAFAREIRSRLPEDARGYGEVASTWQNQIKKQWDTRLDRADISTLPPSHHPPGEEPEEWGPGVGIPTLQPERYGYFDAPKYDRGSEEIEDTVRQFADEYFGREQADTNPTHARLLRGDLARKWMKGWKRVCKQILQLDQQYMPEVFWYRVVGGEQGRSIRATKQEIQGAFNVSLKFNVQDLDAELVKQKLELIGIASGMDLNGLLDNTEKMQVVFELIDPNYAERLLKPAESASMQEMEDERSVFTELLAGNPVDVKGNEAFALRLDTLQKLIQLNPTAQRTIMQDENVRKNVERRVKQLNFNIQQKMVNPDIGRRLGTKPAGMGQ